MSGTCFKRAAISRCSKVYPGKLLSLGIQNVVQTLQNNRLETTMFDDQLDRVLSLPAEIHKHSCVPFIS